MGFWSRLFGRRNAPDLAELEEDGNRLIEVAYRDGKRHGPYKRYRRDGTLLEEGTYEDGERDGPFTIHGRELRIEGTYRTGKLHGPHRALRPDGSVEEEREYDDGVIVRGPHELRDEIHKNWVRERGTMVHGHRDGLWEEFGIPRPGANGEVGPLLKRCFYKDQFLHGRYETWFYTGVPEIEGECREGERTGRWKYWRHDRTLRAELDYDAGELVRWRWLGRDGSERATVEVADDEDLERWLALGDAWEAREQDGTYAVESAVNAWPAHDRARALAWMDERIANRERPKRWHAGDWLDAMIDNDEIDPRTRYVDAIEVDHHEWDEAQTRRLLRFAPQILELGLTECAAHPDLTVLFDVPWPKLESLSLHECGPIDDAIEKLYTSPLAHLALTYDSLSAAAIAKLVEAPWFPTLQSLALTVENRAIVDALATRGMPELRVLELECFDLELTSADVAALIDRDQRPTLERLVLESIVVRGELPRHDGLTITAYSVMST